MKFPDPSPLSRTGSRRLPDRHIGDAIILAIPRDELRDALHERWVSATGGGPNRGSELVGRHPLCEVLERLMRKMKGGLS